MHVSFNQPGHTLGMTDFNSNKRSIRNIIIAANLPITQTLLLHCIRKASHDATWAPLGLTIESTTDGDLGGSIGGVGCALACVIVDLRACTFAFPFELIDGSCHVLGSWAGIAGLTRNLGDSGS